MFCKYCGKQLSDGSRFCKYCGKALAGAANAAAAPEREDRAADRKTAIAAAAPAAQGAVRAAAPQTVAADTQKNRPAVAVENVQPNTASALKRMRCPQCGSEDLQYVTYTQNTNYGVTKGCCGFILMGPLGLLCGLCDKSSQTYEYWVCRNCGAKITNKELDERLNKEEQILRWKERMSQCTIPPAELGGLLQTAKADTEAAMENFRQACREEEKAQLALYTSLCRIARRTAASLFVGFAIFSLLNSILIGPFTIGALLAPLIAAGGLWWAHNHNPAYFPTHIPDMVGWGASMLLCFVTEELTAVIVATTAFFALVAVAFWLVEWLELRGMQNDKAVESGGPEMKRTWPIYKEARANRDQLQQYYDAKTGLEQAGVPYSTKSRR